MRGLRYGPRLLSRPLSSKARPYAAHVQLAAPNLAQREALGRYSTILSH